jgi:NADH-quinone oxidoreductase subunit L
MAGGWMEIPETIGTLWPALPESLHHVTWFTDQMHTALPVPRLSEASAARELTLQVSAGVVSLVGLLLALGFYLWSRWRSREAADTAPASGRYGLRRLWAGGWGFDALYDWVLVQPFVRLAQLNRDDVADRLATGTIWLSHRAHGWLSRTQTGRVRWYAASLAAGSALIVAWVVFS